jgi:two-component system, cell cycle response regulator
MSAPTRIVILQRPGQPLEPVATRLRAWGCAVRGFGGSLEMISTLSRLDTDVVMVDAGVPDSLSVVSEIKADPRTRSLPVVAAAVEDAGVVAPNALALGADDVITLPIDDAELFARVRALSRLSTMELELSRREVVLAEFGVGGPPEGPSVPAFDRIGILLVGPAGAVQIQVTTALGGAASVAYAETAERALDRLRRQDMDVVIITGTHDHEALEALCSAIRADPALFDLPVMLIARPEHFPDRVLPLHWGVSDILFQPFHPEVLRLRVQSWVRQQRLRRRLRGTLDGAVLPPTADRLTRLYSHGFLHGYLEHAMAHALHAGSPLAVAAFGVLKMGRLNHAHGYAAGDRVLAQLSAIILRSTRAEDLPARFGGDLFCVVVNGGSRREAQLVTERIAGIITETPLVLAQGHSAQIGLRTGLSELSRADDVNALVGRAFDRMRTFGLRRAS